MRLGAFLSTAVLCLGTQVGRAQAQAQPKGEPPAGASQPPVPSAPAPDVVMLKSGGMLRGTISELRPNEQVVIVLVTGEVRTIEMDQVDYAGPASKAPSSPGGPKDGDRTVTEIEQALVDGDYEVEEGPEQEGRSHPASRSRRTRRPSRGATLEAEPSRVTFTSDEPGLRVHLHVGSASARVDFTMTSVSVDAYKPLCTTPCTVELEPGTYRIGVAKGNGDPARADEVVTVSDGSVVEVEYDSYTGFRVAGGLIMAGSAIGGIALMMTASNDCPVDDFECDPLDMSQVFAGAAIAGIGGLVGYLMLFKDDEASAEAGLSAALFRPDPRRSDLRDLADASRSPLVPGLSLTGAF